MDHWIFIEEGTYLVEEAFLLTPEYTATALDEAVFEVYLNGRNERRVRGQGMAMNALIVQLLEDHDDIDLLIDLGDEFRYLLKAPLIRAGKAFAPDVKARMLFTAQRPLQKLNPEEYLRIRSRMTMIDR